MDLSLYLKPALIIIATALGCLIFAIVMGYILQVTVYKDKSLRNYFKHLRGTT